MKTYNKPVTLWITYQNREIDADICCKQYNNFDEAYEAMNKYAPEWDCDDGYNPEEWEEEIEAATAEDIFCQFVYYLSRPKNIYLLAQIRPVEQPHKAEAEPQD